MELVSYDIDQINESMKNETKSSAGDKHETARARMQTEHAKLSYRMSELQEQYHVLDRIDINRSTEQVTSENLVYTDKRVFFLAIALGRVELDGQEVYVISKDSPIGKKLIGLKLNETAEFNNTKYKVERIC